MFAPPCLFGPLSGQTLDAVIKARNSAMAAEQKVAANPSDPAAMRELNQAEVQLGGTLGRLFALSEAYPDLKANQNMLALQEELTLSPCPLNRPSMVCIPLVSCFFALCGRRGSGIDIRNVERL